VSDARCRLCTSNDREALIEHVAEHLWESRRNGTLDDRPWALAGEQWSEVMRELAETAITALR
jgi:hypothetical protein